jgi:hypothetical protein
MVPGAQNFLTWSATQAPVAAPGTGNRHIDLLCHLRPGQALVAKLKDLLRGGRMSGSTAPTHGDARTTKLMAHRGRVTPSSAPIWRTVQPWPYKSAARLTSTATP